MAYVARPADFHGATPYRPAPSPAHRRGFWRGFWRALVDAVALSHRREAEREVARYMARRGKLTDGIERDLADRLMHDRF